MNMVKHVGVVENTGTKCVVVFREVPGDPENCLIVGSDTLPDVFHEGLMKVVESDEGQQSLELGELLSRRKFADGSNMLEQLHVSKYLQKVPARQIMLTPNKSTSVRLSEVNNLIRSQQSTKAETTEIVDNEPAVVEDNAKQMLTRAEVIEAQVADMQAEAQRLREDAYALDPSLKQVKRGRPPKQK